MVGVVPYVMLAFSAALTLVLYRAHWETGSPLTPLVMCGVAAAWTLWMYTLHPAWRDRPRLMGLFVAVLLALMTVMVAEYSWLGFYTFTGYYFVYWLVGSWPWRIAGIGLVACLAGVSQGSGIQGTFDLPPAGWRRPSPRTPACTANCWHRHARPGCSTSGSGWPGRSTTRWHRA
jgi:hypothetical protein